MFGNSGVNGARPMGDCVILGNLSEEGRVIALGPYEGQVSSAAGGACWQAAAGAGQVHSILCHTPIRCPLATCSAWHEMSRG